MLAIPKNDVEAIIAHSQHALEYLHPDNLPLRTTITWTLGYAYQLSGDRAAARRAYIEAIPISQRSGNIMITIGSLVCLGQVQEADCHLHEAADTYRKVFPLAGEPPLPGTNEAHLGLARIYYEWNDLEAAERHAQVSLPLALQLENVDSPGVVWLFLSRLNLARGDTSRAVVMFQKAEMFFQERGIVHRADTLAETQIQIVLHQGDVDTAMQIATDHDLPLGRASVLVAQGDASGALTLLEPLRQQMESKGWVDEQLRVMVLQAVAYDLAGETEQALRILSETLTLAASDGLIRLFVDVGPPMEQLLTKAAALGIMPEFTTHLVSAFHDGDIPSSSPQPLSEPLSDRELEVLQLIAEGLSNRQIGERLYLALDTVKGHNRRLYAKLQVERRTEAVARARELGLIES